MRLAKLSAGAERYYLSTVAAGTEDHRPAGLEPDGTWLGSGSSGLGLSGMVSAPHLELVLGGVHPTAQERLNPAQGRIKVVGYDLVFAAPKSISVMFGVADVETSARLADAHQAAVGDALGYLEREAVSARRRVEGKRISVETDGVVAAGFVHRTSRSADPHLHTHVLVANLVKGKDGRWTAMDARGLYAHGGTAGYLYHARLRRELVQHLGLRFAPVNHGVAQLADVPAQVLDQFSQRRHQVEERLKAWGTSTPRAAQMAALATRPAKDTSRSIDQLREEWCDRAGRAGLSQDIVATMLGEARSASAAHPDSEPAGSELDPDAVTAALVERSPTFGRRDLLRALAQSLPAGADVASIERIGDCIVSSGILVEGGQLDPAYRSPEVWHRRDGRRVVSGITEDRWTTARHLRELGRLTEEMTQRATVALVRPESQGPAPSPAQIPGMILEATLARRPQLTTVQAEAVRELFQSSVAIQVVAAQPGPSGTDVIEAARQAWELAGRRVVGLAETPAQALSLESATGIEVVVSTSSPGQVFANHGDGVPSVVVVASADHWGVSSLSALVRSHPDSQLVLLTSVSAPEVAETEVARALRSAVRPIFLPFAAGESRPVASHVEALRVPVDPEHSVVIGHSPAGQRSAIIEDWWQSTQRGERVVMLGRDRGEVDVLNIAARARLREAGKLTEVVRSAGPEMAVGDRMQLRWGHVRHGLEPGQQLSVIGLADGRDLLCRNDDGGQVSIAVAEVCQGQLAHAYAVTPEVAIRTVDTRFLVLGGPDVLERTPPAPEVPGRDRARDAAAEVHHIYGGQPPPAGEIAPPSASRGSELAPVSYYVLGHEPVGDTSRRRDSDRLLAVVPKAQDEFLPDREPDRERSLAALGHESDSLRAAILAGLPPDPSREFRNLADDRAAVELGLANARTLAPGLVPHWQRAAARVGERQLELDQIGGERQRWLEEHRGDLVRYGQLIGAAADRQALLGRVAELVAPERVVELLGPRRHDPAERAVWREAAGAVEGFRERWGITDDAHVLGHEQGRPADRAGRVERSDTHRERDRPRRISERSEVERKLLDAQHHLGMEQVLVRDCKNERDLGRHLERGLEHDLGRH